ncbi:hypothetical protein TWF281_007636 [Arthrobotrys megalospora]
MRALLISVLSVSTVRGYYFGEVYTGQPPQAFDPQQWRPDWRGTSYIGRCTQMQQDRDGVQEVIQGIGIINGAPSPGDLVAGAHRPSISGYNVEAIMFYKSGDCNLLGTDQFIVLKFKQSIYSPNGDLARYRGVSTLDLGLIDGVDIKEYGSYQEVNYRSPDWSWVVAADVPDSEGQAVVFKGRPDGTYRVAGHMEIRNPDQATAGGLARSLENNTPAPVISNLRVALRNIAEYRYRRIRGGSDRSAFDFNRLATQYGSRANVNTGGTGLGNQPPRNNNLGTGSERMANTQGFIPMRPEQRTGTQAFMPIQPGQRVGRPESNWNFGGLEDTGQNLSNLVSRANMERDLDLSLLGGIGNNEAVSLTQLFGFVQQQQREREQRFQPDLRAGPEETIPGLVNQRREGIRGQRSRDQQQQQLEEDPESDPTAGPEEIIPGLRNQREEGTQQQQPGGLMPVTARQSRNRLQEPQPYYEMMQPQFPSIGNLRGQPANPQNMVPQGSQNEGQQRRQQPGPQSQNAVVPQQRGQENPHLIPENPVGPVNNPLDFGFTSTIIPNEGPVGTFGNDIPRLPPQGLDGGERPVPGQGAIQGANEATFESFGLPTSPTLPGYSTDPHFRQDQHRQLNALDRALGREATRPVSFPYTDLSGQYRPAVLPQHARATGDIQLEPNGRPNPFKGWLNEGEMEERNHFPNLFDSTDPLIGGMELEAGPSLGKEEEEEEVRKILDFGSLPNPRSRSRQLYDNWIADGTPILGNLRKLPINMMDRNWEAIDRTYERELREIETDWFDYYQGHVDSMADNYRTVQGYTQNAYNFVQQQKNRAAKELEEAEAQAKRNPGADSLVKQFERAREIQRLRATLGVYDRDLEALRRRLAQEDWKIQRWQRSYDGQLEELEVRYKTWKDMALRNIAKMEGLGTIDRDPKFGSLEPKP